MDWNIIQEKLSVQQGHFGEFPRPHESLDPIIRAACHVSNRLGRRVSQLVARGCLAEALAIVIRILSSATDLRFVRRHSRSWSFQRGAEGQLDETAEEMVESGFYQNSDVIKCFFCGHTLSDWRAGDELMTHANSGSQCFLLESSNFASDPNETHQQLLQNLAAELRCRVKIGLLRYCMTKTLLIMARWRLNHKISDDDLLAELHEETQRPMRDEFQHSGQELFFSECDLASALLQTFPAPAHSDIPVCRRCEARDLAFVCLPCNHLSLCVTCGSGGDPSTLGVCPALGCGKQILTLTRAYIA